MSKPRTHPPSDFSPNSRRTEELTRLRPLPAGAKRPRLLLSWNRMENLIETKKRTIRPAAYLVLCSHRPGGGGHGLCGPSPSLYAQNAFQERRFALATPPRWEGFDAFLLRLTAALDRFELPTDAWRQYKRQFSNDLQTDAPADVWRRYGVPRPPA